MEDGYDPPPVHADPWRTAPGDDRLLPGPEPPLRDQVVTSGDTQPASARGPKEYPCPELFELLFSSLSEDSAAGVAAGAAEPRSSSSRSCDSRKPRRRVRYSRSMVRSSSIFLFSPFFSVFMLFMVSVYLRWASRSIVVALSRACRSRVSARVRASLSIVSALVRASFTIESALDRASESSCSDFVRASASIPS